MTRTAHRSGKVLPVKIRLHLLHAGCISHGRSSKSVRTPSIWTQQMMSHTGISPMVSACTAISLIPGSGFCGTFVT